MSREAGSVYRSQAVSRIDDPLWPFRAGVSTALAVVAAYVAATFGGIFLGTWSAGLDSYGLEACFYPFLGSLLGLRHPVGLVCAMGIGLSTLLYFHLRILRWESLNLLALLWTLYAYVALGAGQAGFVAMTIRPARPSPWRIVISIAAVGLVYTTGRLGPHVTRGLSPLLVGLRKRGQPPFPTVQ